MREFFQPGGLLSDTLTTFEYRPCQLEMAEAVSRALGEGREILIEAPTGVGKSLAYLIPLADLINKGEIERAVVSTYTKTLQRQLIERDIPIVMERFFPHLRYSVCFGSENYLCLRRFNNAFREGLFEDLQNQQVSALRKWVELTEEGLYMEVMPPSGLWIRVCRETDLCHGRECAYFQDCFYQKARQNHRRSQLLVVNHHLFFANMASGWNVLPGFSHVVFDEAHELERVATEYLGAEVSNTRLKYLLDGLLNKRGRGLIRRLHLEGLDVRRLEGTIGRIRAQGEEFFNRVAHFLGQERSRRLSADSPFVDNLSEHLDYLAEELRGLSLIAETEELSKDLKVFSQRCRQYIETLDLILKQGLEGYLYWADREGRRLRLVATPLEPADILRSHLFKLMDASVITSATLTVGGSFEYVKRSLGLEDAETLLIESPFDFLHNALLYICPDMPDPESPVYIERVTEEIERILEVSRGRTLVLYTSYSLLNDVASRIRSSHLTILKQGDEDNYNLIMRFRRTDNAVLLGTYSFWQGVDIPGDALQCVVITKLPFPVPTEPLIEARMELAAERGLDPFYEVQLPMAVITFRQGFGRLIRRATDRGIVAVLDSRILRRAYGRSFLRSLPEIQMTTDIERVRSFFRSDVLI